MRKKIIYGILICIIIAGAVIIGVKGLEVDIAYSKNVRIDVYLGKTFENEDMKQIAQEVFGDNRILVQKVEYYEDMASITIKQENAENMDEKLEELNTKINEKYDLENSVEDIQVTYQPKIKLSSILAPYIVPLMISSIIILIYIIVRYRKIGIIKTVAFYALVIFAVEALFLSILAIARIPVNRLVMPIGLSVYVICVTSITAMKEKQLASFREEEQKKKK